MTCSVHSAWAVTGLLGLGGCLLALLPIGAWLTHVITCFEQDRWGFLIAGAIFFPIAIAHGIWLWFHWLNGAVIGRGSFTPVGLCPALSCASSVSITLGPRTLTGCWAHSRAGRARACVWYLRWAAKHP